ncbi:MAG TPA: His/Gly/Thr/Pro-type tRNA ligase C-terminal domain-containing protein [Candidatus Paceibacterota bacterium]|nr:His/Gly/Thr/Pro-type tRNA ligase C-terminal domain-containing protein [Candidatus Paceibacterota bacterium]
MMRTTIPAEELVSKARTIGQYYGFTPLALLAAKGRGAPRPKALDVSGVPGLAGDPVADAVASFLKQCRASGCEPSANQPLFVWHTNIAPGRPAPKKAIVQFHALGTDRPLADAVVIRAALALVRDLFHEEPVVRVNSMGDKETRARYARELANFFKKRAASLPEDCVSCAKRDALEAAELAIARECADDLPAPTEHLSDASRKRFEDLLEYLETTETPYELARELISRGGVWSETCFELTVGGKRVVWGSRYNDLTRHMFDTGAFPAMGAVLQIASDGPVTKKLASGRPRFFFIHIGDEAKRLSIRLAEDFRRARLPVWQNIGIESLTEQLRVAERRDCPYLLVMGRKEALEGSAILRNRQTQEEVIVPVAELTERLRTVA